jgi:hypothetical protein
MASSNNASDPGGRDPQNPYNQTTQLHSEALWSESNHPKILGQLDPHPGRLLLKGERLPYLKEDGKVVRDSKKNPIRDFPFLPRHLSNNLEPFRYEAYLRMDPRLEYHDLWARMPSTTPLFHGNSLWVRALRMDITRKVRDRNNGRCWDAKGHQLPRRNIELVEKLTQEQIELNTTWNVTSDGIRQPGQSPTSNPLPRNYFLALGEVSHTLGPELQNARNELRRLQSIAERKSQNSWKDVTEDHPYQWTMRRRKVIRAREAAEAVEAAQARSTHEAALAMLELASGRRDSDNKSKHENAESTNQALSINTVCSDANPKEDGNESQLISLYVDDLHDRSAEAGPEEDGTKTHSICIDADDFHDGGAHENPKEDSTGEQDMADDGDDLYEGHANCDNDETAQPAPDIEADLEEYTTEDELMSDDSNKGDLESDEIELRLVTRVVQGADGIFSKS